MLNKFHQSIRHPFFWVLVITISLFLQTIVYAAQVTLTWGPNNPTPDGYRVYARIEGQTYDYASPVWPQSGADPAQTTCTVDNLVEGTSYYFVVRAYTGNTESGDSNEINRITEEAQPTAYTITTNAGANGTISPTSATVNAGDSQTFTITPDTGYHVDDVVVDGVSMGAVATYTFSELDADHSIAASFAADAYTIEASAGSGGAIAPSGAVSVPYGGSHTFTITPDAGSLVEDVVVDGVSVGAVTTYTFSELDADHSIAASFAVEAYTIEASAGSGGAIAPSGAVSVPYGGSHTFTITPDSGYHVKDVMVDGVSVGTVTTYTFSAMDADHSIMASFAADTHTVDASAGSGGFISPSGNMTISAGSSQSFTIGADDGYEIDDVIVDGNSVGALESYNFQYVDADHTIEARFRPINQLPVADAGPDQVVDEQTTVTLSGLNSKDMDDGIAAFEWRQIKGTAVNLSSASAEMASFVAPNVDTHGEALEFELTVTDFSGAQSSDRCIVNVSWVNEAPIANAGADQSVNEGGTVELSAADSSDPDDGIAGYEWLQVQGPMVNLSNAHSPSPSFAAPDVDAQGASLVFQLTVTDGGGLQDTDHCTVIVTWDNMEPEADAGPDQQVNVGDDVQLDGSRSMDPDGLDLNYQWRQTFGPPVVLSDATAVRPMFKVPTEGFAGAVLTFELTVTDSGGLQGVDVCEVGVYGAEQPQDTTPPTLAILYPKDNPAVVTETSVSLYGRAEDDTQVVRVSWQNSAGGGGDAARSNGWWWIEKIELRLGRNTLTVTAIDAAGNQQSQQITVYRIKESWWKYIKQYFGS